MDCNPWTIVNSAGLIAPALNWYGFCITEREANLKGACVKITISSQGNNLDSAVDPRFGRAAQFILFDTETKSYETISNDESVNAGQGAGIKAAETMSRLGAKVLITGHCGPNAFKTLSAAGIEIVLGAEGITVAQAVEKYQSGQLKPSGSSDVTGHWQ